MGREKLIYAGKSKSKFSEASWLEYLVYKKIFLTTNKTGKYLDFLGRSIFLNTLGVLLIILLVSY